jgi:4-hydroxybenzoate polyprenyltransferase
LKTTSFPVQAGITRLNLFLALSRTPHLLLDLATPGLAALLCLGAFPPASVIVLGLITAFSGYTAVYALNDIIDYRVDKELIHSNKAHETKPDLDSVLIRHPLAQGMLSYREALLWASAWAVLALAGAFFLNPICIAIFLGACMFEVIYCYLLKITHLRSIISGIVKTSGPIAAVFAVTPQPSMPFLIILFLWLFFWEIGGQNVPNDLSDLDTDQQIKARTIPVRFGAQVSIKIICTSLAFAVAMSVAMFWIVPNHISPVYLLGAMFSGLYFILIPAYHLYNTRGAAEAFQLFNRCSYYPLSMLLTTVLSLTLF